MHTANNIIRILQSASEQFWIFHVQTKSYTEHKALEGIYNSITEYRDKLAERITSFYPEATADLSGELVIELRNYKSAQDCVKSAQDLLEALDNLFVEKEKKDADVFPSDILNLRDELVSEIRQGIYLLGLK